MIYGQLQNGIFLYSKFSRNITEGSQNSAIEKVCRYCADYFCGCDDILGYVADMVYRGMDPIDVLQFVPF